MPKKIMERGSEEEVIKTPKKKGRPRKNPKPLPPRAVDPSKQDDIMLARYLREAIVARRIHTLLDLYDSRAEIVRYILESYEFGELSVLERRPAVPYLEQKIVNCFRDMH